MFLERSVIVSSKSSIHSNPRHGRSKRSIIDENARYGRSRKRRRRLEHGAS